MATSVFVMTTVPRRQSPQTLSQAQYSSLAPKSPKVVTSTMIKERTFAF